MAALVERQLVATRRRRDTRGKGVTRPPRRRGVKGGAPRRLSLCALLLHIWNDTKIVVIILAAVTSRRRFKGQGGDETRGEVCNSPRFYSREFFLALPLHAARRPVPCQTDAEASWPGRARAASATEHSAPRPAAPAAGAAQRPRAGRLSRTRAMQLGHQKSFANVTHDSKRTRGLPRRSISAAPETMYTGREARHKRHSLHTTAGLTLRQGPGRPPPGERRSRPPGTGPGPVLRYRRDYSTVPSKRRAWSFHLTIGQDFDTYF